MVSHLGYPHSASEIPCQDDLPRGEHTALDKSAHPISTFTNSLNFCEKENAG